MSNKSYKEVQNKLTKMISIIDQLTDEIENKSQNQDRRAITAKYAEFKQKLQSETNFFNTAKGEKSASEAEVQYYFPAVADAYSDLLDVKTNAPSSDKMIKGVLWMHGSQFPVI